MESRAYHSSHAGRNVIGGPPPAVQTSKTRQGNGVWGAPLPESSVQNARRIYFTLATCRIHSLVHPQSEFGSRGLSAFAPTSNGARRRVGLLLATGPYECEGHEKARVWSRLVSLAGRESGTTAEGYSISHSAPSRQPAPRRQCGTNRPSPIPSPASSRTASRRPGP